MAANPMMKAGLVEGRSKIATDSQINTTTIPRESYDEFSFTAHALIPCRLV